jgi:protein-L-isoaspartate(D-aspartate) O-methyltransferase
MKSFIYAIFLLPIVVLGDATDFAAQRAALVADLENIGRLMGDMDGKGFSEDVLEAMNTVPRHALVPTLEIPYAYENRPLPIGHGQTISQPYIVALMTDLADPDHDDIVLEIGTGSGYQAAVLAELVAKVYTIEIIEPLAERAKRDLLGLGYDNVTTKLGDGYYGWEEHAPFDAIVVTAAASHVPPPLIRQLKPGGRMVIPVGGRFTTQELLLLTKNEAGEVFTRQMGAVRFVPLTGQH